MHVAWALDHAKLILATSLESIDRLTATLRRGLFVGRPLTPVEMYDCGCTTVHYIHVAIKLCIWLGKATCAFHHCFGSARSSCMYRCKCFCYSITATLSQKMKSLKTQMLPISFGMMGWHGTGSSNMLHNVCCFVWERLKFIMLFFTANHKGEECGVQTRHCCL